MIAYIKARAAELSTKIGAITGAISAAALAASQAGGQWAKIVFGATLAGSLAAIFTPEKPK